MIDKSSAFAEDVVPICDFLSALVASSAISNAAEPRPTLKEWEKGQANNTAKTDAEAAKQAKMAAVDKVVSMLEDLRLQVLASHSKKSFAVYADPRVACGS